MNTPVSEITTPSEYRSVQSALTRADRPPAILRALMRVFEAYRAARKIGWSRPWNKYGVTTFIAFGLRFPDDDDLRVAMHSVISGLWGSEIARPDQTFLVDLLTGSTQPMGFAFLHDIEEGECTYEGVTLSIGRKAADSPRHRDRIDLIFEREILNGSVTDNRRVRVYIDPYRGVKDAAFVRHVSNDQIPPDMLQLEQALLDRSFAWADDASRHWDHWSSAYVDYFGSRKSIPRNSRLPSRVAKAAA